MQDIPKGMEIMEKVDYKTKYKDLYLPKTRPSLISVPEMAFFAVNGKGDPNVCAEYKEALEILYGLSFTVKMSKMNGTQPEGYFEYTVPPLEGLWYVEDEKFDGMNIADKDQFQWISMIRQPEFVTKKVFEDAKAALAKKKPGLNLGKARWMTYSEGLCVQIMHMGTYDDEPLSIRKIKAFADENGYAEDFSGSRFHHEIYLSDPRRCAPEKLKTVIRHPVKKIEI